MRRLLALPVLAAALCGVAPASAAVKCTPLAAGAGVCYQVSECPDVCFVHPIVDPYCSGDPATLACREVNSVRVDLGRL